MSAASLGRSTGKVAMKAASKVVKKQAPKMKAVQTALTPAQQANKARKVAARQASKARRKANVEAWKNSPWEANRLSADFWDTKRSRREREIFNEIKDPIRNISTQEFNSWKPLARRGAKGGITRAFSPDDREVLRAISQTNLGEAFKNDPYRNFRGENVYDETVNQFSRIMETLRKQGGDNAVEAFKKLIPTWEGTIEELALIALIV